MVDEIKKIKCENVPPGSRFKGYRKYIVQDLIIQVKTTEHKLEQWQAPDGKYVVAQLPKDVDGSHFGPCIKQYIIFQHHSNRVPQNKIYEQLREMGVNISAGEIETILRDAAEQFKPEKEDILDAGMHCSSYVQSDDTGARHAGKNGFCTVIGNDLFAYYASTSSKSRINFLRILQGKNTDFVINESTIEYCKSHKFKDKLLDFVQKNESQIIGTLDEWNLFLKQYGMTDTQKRILTEGAMIGSLFHHGIPKDIVLVSDDAKQFNLFIHALCWAHAIRNIKKIIASDDEPCNEVENVLTSLRKYYKKLKEYSITPSQEAKATLWLEFDSAVAINVTNPALKKALALLLDNKDELLRILDYPFIPLTNNGSERDIRPYVIKRKISGGTRSEAGRPARDTFSSLSATCRKQNISFWFYLDDRLRKTNKISNLADIIRQKAQSASTP